MDEKLTVDNRVNFNLRKVVVNLCISENLLVPDVKTTLWSKRRPHMWTFYCTGLTQQDAKLKIDISPGCGRDGGGMGEW